MSAPRGRNAICATRSPKASCTQAAILRQGRLTAIGTLGALKAATGNPGASMDQVFTYYTGDTVDTVEENGAYLETAAMRRATRKLGR